MRASSLSNRDVIDLLSNYFVPVWLSTDDFELVPKDRKETEAYQRYKKQAKAQGLSASTVQVYIIMPDGTLRTTLHVAKAIQGDNLRSLLAKTVEECVLEPRPAGTRRPPQMRPRRRAEAKDGVEFHVMARYLGPRASSGVAEAWIPVTAAECAQFVPRELRKDLSWSLPAETTNKIYRQFFPPLPNYTPDRSRVEESSLTATVEAVDGDRALLRLRGTLHMKRSVTIQERDSDIRARTSGYALVNGKTRTLQELGLVTDDADFVWYWQGKPQPSKITASVEYDAP
jgi:hypothetical protein